MPLPLLHKSVGSLHAPSFSSAPHLPLLEGAAVPRMCWSHTMTETVAPGALFSPFTILFQKQLVAPDLL